MNFRVEIQISGERATLKGGQPFAVQGADRSGKHAGFVLIDCRRVNCVRYDSDSLPVIFSDSSVIRMLADDLNRR